MINDSFFDLSFAFRSFASARDCTKLNSFPSIYQLIYTLAFGGCGQDKGELDRAVQNIMSLDSDELEL